jgi:predicted ATPase
LDNREHVIDAAAEIVEDMLNRCPHLSILATSREALATGDELQVLVSPLEAPPQSARPEDIAQYPAAQLFLERAADRRSGLRPTDDELLAVGRICRELDGIPLALELAAARMSAMTPLDIAERLGDRFALLTTGSRTADARQRTLRATVDWSHGLLSERDRRAFARLSVFRGGWTLTSAESVIADDNLAQDEVVEIVAGLVERSLVVVEVGVSARYRMLETLREYAAEQLAERGDDAATRERHARYFLRYTEQADRDLRDHRQRDALRRLRTEQPNIRAALTWFRSPGNDIDGAMSLAGSLGLFWHLGRHVEGRALLRELLVDDRGATEARARALQAVSLVERPRGCLVHPSERCSQAARDSMAVFEYLDDHARAAVSKVLLAVEGVTGAFAEESRELLAAAEHQFVADEDEWGLAVIGFVRMETALKTGDQATAVAVGRRTASAFRQLDDPWGLSAILYHLGWGLRQFGRYDEAARVLEEAIDVAAGAGLFNTVQWAQADLGVTHINLGDPDSARDSFDRARIASEHVGDDAGQVLARYGHALLAQVRNDFDEARPGFRASADGFDALGTPVSTGLAMAGLARCDEAVGDAASASGLYQDVLAIGRGAGEPGLVAAALEGLARVGGAAGDLTNEALLSAEARRIRTQAHRPAPPYETVQAAGAIRG